MRTDIIIEGTSQDTLDLALALLQNLQGIHSNNSSRLSVSRGGAGLSIDSRTLKRNTYQLGNSQKNTCGGDKIDDL